MAEINLGNVVGLLPSPTAPVKTNVLWGRPIDPAIPGLVEIFYYSQGEWLPLHEPRYWWNPVLNKLSTPPALPANRDRYLVDANPTGAWASHAGKVAIWDTASATWSFKLAYKGVIMFIAGKNEFNYFDGATWTSTVTNAPPATQKDLTWKPDVNYNTDANRYAEYDLKLWKSLINSPTNNIGITPVEGSTWTEVSKAEAGSDSNILTPYQPGAYIKPVVLVLRNRKIYELAAPERPFESIDFSAELTAGKWVLVSGDSSSIPTASQIDYTTGDVNSSGRWGATTLKVSSALTKLMDKFANYFTKTETAAEIKSKAQSADYSVTDTPFWGSNAMTLSGSITVLKDKIKNLKLIPTGQTTQYLGWDEAGNPIAKELSTNTGGGLGPSDVSVQIKAEAENADFTGFAEAANLKAALVFLKGLIDGKITVSRMVATYDLLPGDAKNSENVYVTDASLDTTVNSGWAIYKSIGDQGTAGASWAKIAEQESLDVVFSWGSITGTITNQADVVSYVAARIKALAEGADFTTGDTGTTGFWGAVTMSIQAALRRLQTKNQDLDTRVQTLENSPAAATDKMTKAQREAIISPAIGLEVYQTDGLEGTWLYTSMGWISLMGSKILSPIQFPNIAADQPGYVEAVTKAMTITAATKTPEISSFTLKKDGVTIALPHTFAAGTVFQIDIVYVSGKTNGGITIEGQFN